MSGLVFSSLVVQNFKSFYGEHKFKLDRPSGLYYIAGRNKVAPELGANGVGKTTLPGDALTWVAYGKTGRDNRPADAVVPWGLKRGTTSVTLAFRRGRNRHVLVRERNPNNLVLDGVVVEQAAVTAALGVSEEMFRRTIVLSQFGSLFLDLSPEQQTQIFNEALSLDLWTKASERAGKQTKDFAGVIAAGKIDVGRLEGQLSELDQQIEETKEASESYAENLQDEVKRLREQLADVRGRSSSQLAAPKDGVGRSRPSRVAGITRPPTLADQQAALSVVEAGKKVHGRKIRDVEADLSRVQSELRTAGQELKSYTAAMSGDKKCPACAQKVSTAHLEAKFRACKDAIKTLTAQHEEGAAVLAELRDELEVLEADHERLRVAVEAALQQDRESTKISDQIRRLETQENPHKAVAASLAARKASLEHKDTEARALLATLERQLATSEYWVGAFREIRLSLIDEALRELDMAVTRNVEALGLAGWQIQFSTEKVKASGAVAAALTIHLTPPGRGDVTIKFQSYSGGESQRLQLAMSLGLSEVILARAGVETNIEIFDEPTRGLSTEGVSDLLEHLARRAVELDRVIFVTEHHSLERGMFTSTIVVEKDSTGSRIIEGA